MKLGEKIYKLRNLNKMSQEDLANKLKVSRQSISKWENNTSVPELEKLIQLSEVFQITLDELVKGKEISGETAHSKLDLACETKEERTEKKTDDINEQGSEEIPKMQSDTQTEYEAQVQRNANAFMSTQRIIGLILLTVGLFSLILAFVFGGGLAILGSYLILCSILCLLVKKYAGLVIGWTTFILCILSLTPFTGISMIYVFVPAYWGTINSLFGMIMWIVLGVLIFFTYRVVRKKRR